VTEKVQPSLKIICKSDPPLNLSISEEALEAAIAAEISQDSLKSVKVALGLWWKITPAALKQLAATEAWRTHAPADTTPEEIYGRNGSMGHFFNEPFATRADLQDALGQNHGGGVQMEVIEALAALCGPRVEGAGSP
jgi:hypothetical protein